MPNSLSLNATWTQIKFQLHQGRIRGNISGFKIALIFDCLSETGTACDLGMHTGQHAALVLHDEDASELKIDQNQNRPSCIEQLK